MVDMPGTVSKILWHFAGGPTWNAKENRQNKHPKSARAAYAALVSILQSRELRIGQFKEVVKVRVPYVRKHDPKTDTFKYEKNVLVEEMSVPVCCLADIPVAHCRTILNVTESLRLASIVKRQSPTTLIQYSIPFTMLKSFGLFTRDLVS
jgi:hypothetical protein